MNKNQHLISSADAGRVDGPGAVPEPCPTCGAARQAKAPALGYQFDLFARLDAPFGASVAAPDGIGADNLPEALLGDIAPESLSGAAGGSVEALVEESTILPKPSRPSARQDALTPKERLALNLEIAVWFVGVMLALGGALMATRLFWGDINPLLRPAVIGLGLGGIGGSLLAAGGILHGRYPRSFAGGVLGVVGQIFAMASALPIASISAAHSWVAVASFGVLIAVVGLGYTVAYKFGRAQTRASALVLLGGMALTALAPVSLFATALVTVLGAMLTRAGFALNHARALRKNVVFVEDAAALAAGAFSVSAAFFSSAAEMAPRAAVFVVGVAATLDALMRMLEARALTARRRHDLRRLLSAGVAALAASIVLQGWMGSGWPVATAAACLMLGSVLLSPTRLGLPPASKIAAWIFLAQGAGFLGRAVLPFTAPLSWWLCTNLVFALLAWRAARSSEAHEQGFARQIGLASIGLVIFSSPLLWPLAGGGIAMLPLAVLLLAHVAAERTLWLSGAGMASLLVAAGALIGPAISDEQRLFPMLGAAALWALAALRGKLAGRRSTFALASVSILGFIFVFLTHGLGAGAGAEIAPFAALAALVAAALLAVSGEVSRTFWPLIVGGLILVLATHFAFAGSAANAVLTLALSALALVPRSSRRMVNILAPGARLGGRGPYLRALALTTASIFASLPVFYTVATESWTREVSGLSLGGQVAAWQVAALIGAAGIWLFRTRSAVALLGLATTLMAGGWWLGGMLRIAAPHIGSAVGTLMVGALILFALVVWRQRGGFWTLEQRGRARRGRTMSLAVPTLGVVGISAVAGAVALSTHSMHSILASAEASPLASAATIFLLVAIVLLLGFCARAWSGLLLAGQVTSWIAGGLMVAASLSTRVALLGWAVLLIASVPLWAWVARKNYRRAGHSWFHKFYEEAPAPDVVRALPYLFGVGLSAAAAGLMALLRQHAWRSAALDSGLMSYLEVGLPVLAVAGSVACLIVMRLDRRLPAFVGGSLSLAALIFSVRSLGRTVGWSESSGGVGSAFFAFALVVVAVALQLPAIRIVLAQLGVPLVRKIRRPLSTLAMMGASILGTVALLRSVTTSVGPTGLVPLLIMFASFGAAVFYSGRMSITIASLLSAGACIALVDGLGSRELNLGGIGGLSLVAIVIAIVDWAAPWLFAWRFRRRLAVITRLSRGHLLPRLQTAARRLLPWALFGIAVGLEDLFRVPQPIGGVLVMSVAAALLTTLRDSRRFGLSIKSWWRPSITLALIALIIVLGFNRRPASIHSLYGFIGVVGAWTGLAWVWLQDTGIGRRVLRRARLQVIDRGKKASRQSAVMLMALVVLMVVLGSRGKSDQLFLAAAAMAAFIPLFFVVPGRMTRWVTPLALTTCATTIVVAISSGIYRGMHLGLSNSYQDPLEVVSAALVAWMVVAALGQALFVPLCARLDHRQNSAALGQDSVYCRGVFEVLALAGLVVAFGMQVVDTRPSNLALGANWITLGCAFIVLTTIGRRRGEPLWTTIGHGVLLGIYLDLRRRTGLLDAYPLADAIFSIGASAVFLLLRRRASKQSQNRHWGQAAEFYAATLPALAAVLGGSDGSRALLLMAAGGVWAVLSRSRRGLRYELLTGGALLVASWFALRFAGSKEIALYALPLALLGTWLGRRYRRRLGSLGRWLSVSSQIPTYVTAAWTALSMGTILAFAFALAVSLGGLAYAYRARDRRALYAAGAQAVVLVVGRLLMAGFENVLLGTLLLVGAGFAVLGTMTVLSIGRERAAKAFQTLRTELNDWDTL